MDKELREINKIKKVALKDWKDKELHPLARIQAFDDFVQATTAERMLR